MAAHLETPASSCVQLCQSMLGRGPGRRHDLRTAFERVVKSIKTCLESIPTGELVGKVTLFGRLHDALGGIDRLLDRVAHAGSVVLLLHSQEIYIIYQEIRERVASVCNSLGFLHTKYLSPEDLISLEAELSLPSTLLEEYQHVYKRMLHIAASALQHGYQPQVLQQQLLGELRQLRDVAGLSQSQLQEEAMTLQQQPGRITLQALPAVHAARGCSPDQLHKFLVRQVCIAISPKATFVKQQMGHGGAAAAAAPAPATAAAAPPSPAGSLAAKAAAAAARAAATARGRAGSQQEIPPLPLPAPAAGGKWGHAGAHSQGLVSSAHRPGSIAGATAQKPLREGRYDNLAYSPSGSSTARTSPRLLERSITPHLSSSRDIRSTGSSSRVLGDSSNSGSLAGLAAAGGGGGGLEGSQGRRFDRPQGSFSPTINTGGAVSQLRGGEHVPGTSDYSSSSQSTAARQHSAAGDIGRPRFSDMPRLIHSTSNSSIPDVVGGTSGQTVARKNPFFNRGRPSSRSSSRPRSRSESRGSSCGRLGSSQALEQYLSCGSPSAASFQHEDDEQYVDAHDYEVQLESYHERLLGSSVRSDEGSLDVAASRSWTRRGASTWWTGSSNSLASASEQGRKSWSELGAAAAGEAGIASRPSRQQGEGGHVESNVLREWPMGGGGGSSRIGGTAADSCSSESSMETAYASLDQYPKHKNAVAAAAVAGGRKGPVGWSNNVGMQQDPGLPAMVGDRSSSSSSASRANRQAGTAVAFSVQNPQPTPPTTTAAAPATETAAGAVGAVRGPVGWSKMVEFIRGRAPQEAASKQQQQVSSSKDSNRDTSDGDGGLYTGKRTSSRGSNTLIYLSSSNSMGSSSSCSEPTLSVTSGDLLITTTAAAAAPAHSSIHVNDTRVHVEEARFQPGRKTADGYVARGTAGAGHGEVWMKGAAKRLQGAYKAKQQGAGGFEEFHEEEEETVSWVWNRKVGLVAVAVLLLMVVGGVAAGVIYLKKIKSEGNGRGAGPPSPSAHNTAATCPVSYTYNSTARPLLYGGIYDSSCKPAHPRACHTRATNHTNDAYSADTCSFLFGGFASTCTKEQRDAFEPYAKAVSGGEMLGLSPCMLWDYLRGRTLWLMGDSHGQVFFKSLACFLADFWDHNSCLPSQDMGLVEQLLQMTDVPNRAGVNKPECMHLLGMTRICLVRAIRGGMYLPEVDPEQGGSLLPFVQENFAKAGDIFIINFGSWHRYGYGYLKEHDDALKALVKHYEATKTRWPHVMFKLTPAAHQPNMTAMKCDHFVGVSYDAATGALNTAGAASIDKLASSSEMNSHALDILRNSGIAVLGELSYNMSVALAEQHVGDKVRGWSTLDCLHYCQGGIPQVWIWETYEAFKWNTAGIAPLPPEQQAPLDQKYPCSPADNLLMLIGNATRGFRGK